MYLDGGSHFMIGPRAGRGPSLDSVTITPTGSTTRTIRADSAFGLPRSPGASGYTGTGFADFSDRPGDRLVFWPAGNGEYELEFRYANGGSTSRPLLLWQGFATALFQQYLPFEPTGSWSTWKTERVRVHLSPTTTPIELQAIGYGGPNIDSL